MSLERGSSPLEELPDIHEQTLVEFNGFFQGRGVQDRDAPFEGRSRYANLIIRPVDPGTFDMYATVSFHALLQRPVPEMIEWISYEVLGPDGRVVARGVFDDEDYTARFSVPPGCFPFTVRFSWREDLRPPWVQ